MKQGSNTDAPGEGAQPARGTRRDESRRKYDPEQTKRNILEVATQEFSAMGLTGARVDAIAERTNTTKRMLYYYFDSKEGLYEAVLEKVYGDIRALELELNVGELPPVEGMRRLVEFTFDYHDRHRDFVRLVSIENIHGAKYIEQLKSFKNRNVSIIKTIEELLARGVESRRFPRRRRRFRPASDDQLVLLPSRREPLHLRRRVRPRSVGTAPARAASHHDRRLRARPYRALSRAWTARASRRGAVAPSRSPPQTSRTGVASAIRAFASGLPSTKYFLAQRESGCRFSLGCASACVAPPLRLASIASARAR